MSKSPSPSRSPMLTLADVSDVVSSRINIAKLRGGALASCPRSKTRVKAIGILRKFYAVASRLSNAWNLCLICVESVAMICGYEAGYEADSRRRRRRYWRDAVPDHADLRDEHFRVRFGGRRRQVHRRQAERLPLLAV